jgi:hypothetical protein
MIMSCSTGIDIAGTGSESPNALTGTVYSQQENVLISLYSIDSLYDSLNHLKLSWQIVDSSLTDSSGRFSFNIDSTGQYTVLASFQNLKAFSGIINITSKQDINSVNLELKQTINIFGKLNDTSSTTYSVVKLGIIGTPYITECYSNSNFTFFDVPQGNLKYYADILSIHTRCSQDTNAYYDTSSFATNFLPIIISSDTISSSIGNLPISYISTINP